MYSKVCKHVYLTLSKQTRPLPSSLTIITMLSHLKQKTIGFWNFSEVDTIIHGKTFAISSSEDQNYRTTRSYTFGINESKSYLPRISTTIRSMLSLEFLNSQVCTENTLAGDEKWLISICKKVKILAKFTSLDSNKSRILHAV